MAVTVAACEAVGAGPALRRADHRVRVGGQQGVDHRLQEVMHQFRSRLGQGLAKQAMRIDNMGCGLLGDCFSRGLSRIPRKDHTVTAPTSSTTRPTTERNTISRDLTPFTTFSTDGSIGAGLDALGQPQREETTGEG